MAEEDRLDTPAAADAPASDAGSTSAPATEAPAAPADAAPVAGAEAAKDAPKSAYEAVKRVMDASRAKDVDAAAPAAKEQPDTAAPAADSSGVDLTRERIEAAEWRALPEKERQRITQFRARLKDYGGMIQSMTPKAKTYDDLTHWMGTCGVNQDDFVGGLQIIALLRSDPVEAWKQLQPVIAELRARIGDELPDDLRKSVEEGVISEPHAKELALARNERARLEEAARQRDNTDLVRQDQAEQQAAHDHIRKAIEGWEATWRASDPDYPKKAERVWESMFTMLEAERSQGKPVTRDRVLEIAKAARTRVEGWMSGFAPAARPKTPVTTNGSGAATVKQPGSALEAARLAIGR